ncbi:hypothetical protein LZC95_29830 [Pendulispora brunnea]|uniref:Uncharacterized protein n=1 Tax=Pendulispora brunnea TaxID=2905690 RepID=A0ABZ2K1L4_9BACT
MRTIIQLGSNGNDETGNLPVSASTMAHDAHDVWVRRLDRLALECLEVPVAADGANDRGAKPRGGWPFFEAPSSAPAPAQPRRGRGLKALPADRQASPRRRRRESEETRAAVERATAGFVCAFM